MTKTSRTDPQVNFRIPSELIDQIKADAKANGRSMNAEVIARLEGSTETLRDKAALAALSSMCRDYEITGAMLDVETAAEIAGDAYIVADAFLTARSEPSR